MWSKATNILGIIPRPGRAYGIPCIAKSQGIPQDFKAAERHFWEMQNNLLESCIGTEQAQSFAQLSEAAWVLLIANIHGRYWHAQWIERSQLPFHIGG